LDLFFETFLEGERDHICIHECEGRLTFLPISGL
jgi:hypothetical protein